MIIELAGIPVEVSLRYGQNEEFLQDYICDRAPAFSLSPADDDLAAALAAFDRQAESDGTPRREYPAAFLERNALHAMLAEKFPEYGVLLMHGSAFAMDGEGIILTAKSGVGKSTHARFWREVYGDRVRMINDDKPLIRFSAEGIRVYGSPWDGKHHLSSNSSVPLRAVAVLHRDTVNHIAAMAKPDAFSAVLRQFYHPYGASAGRAAVELIGRLTREAAFYSLGCTCDASAAVVAKEGILGRG